MNKVKILHCGDLHFDTPFKELNSKLAEISKEEILEVFRNIIDITIKEEVQLLLLAGDIFDNLTVNKKTLYFIKSQLDRLNKTKVFISPGNHDPYNEKSFYKLIDWPENIYVFKGSLEKVELEELGVNIYGAAFNENHVNKSLLKNIEVNENYINIMVMHGDISTVEGGNNYNPVTLEEIGNSKMDYIALGHRHSFSGIERAGFTHYAYSGCPQGRGFDELGDKGIIIGTVRKRAVDLDFHKTSGRNYCIQEIDISNCYGYEEILIDVVNSIGEEDRYENLYKIVLTGELENTFVLDRKILEEKLKGHFYFAKVKDDTKIKINLDEISKSVSVKGVFVKKLLELLENAEDEDKEEIELAIKIGLQCFNEEEVKLDDN